MTTITKDIISGLSIAELKQMLARVNHDLKMNKPKLNRKAKAAARINTIVDNEYITANNIAARFTNKQYDKPIENAKLIADIQIQKDILEFINNGGRIITAKTTGRLNSKPVNGAVAGMKLFRRFA